MKKLITKAILLALLIPNISLASYKPATLFRGQTKVVVRSQSEASHFFSLGYKLYVPGMLGISIPSIVALYEDSLASKISNSATSMTLVNGQDNAGTALNGFYGFILDEGSSNEEFVTANCVGTACTGMTRGISLTDGKTSVTALKFEHRRAGSVKITNYPQLSIISRILSGQESTPGGITFATGTITGLTVTPDSSSTSTVANVEYVNNVATSGAPNISETTKGVGEIATQAEASAGTSVGGTGARLLLPASMATTTGASGTTTIPMTGTNGKIDQGFIDLTQLFNFSLLQSASSTFTGTTTFQQFPSTPNSYPTASTSVANKGYVDNTFIGAIASSNLRQSADTEQTTSSASPDKRKEILISTTGTYRIVYDLRSGGGGTQFGNIYRNGSAYGTQQATSSTSYVTYSQDLIFFAGDLLQMYIWTNGSGSVLVRNFRVYYDLGPVSISTTTPTVILN